MKYFKEHLDAILYTAINLLFWVGVFTISVKVAVNITMLMSADSAQVGYDSAYPFLFSVFLGTPIPSGVSGLNLSVYIYLFTFLFALVKFLLPRATNIKEIISKHQAYSVAMGGVLLNYVALQAGTPFLWVNLLILSLTLSVCIYLYLASRNERLLRWWDKRAVTIDRRSPIVASILTVMLFWAMPNPGNSYSDIYLENLSQQSEPFNLVATVNLGHSCITEDITHTAHPYPFFLGIAKEPCYLNRYAIDGERFTEAEKRYLLLLDGGLWSYIIYSLLYTPGETFDIRLQVYLDGYTAMEEQIERFHSYKELDTPFAVDKVSLSRLEKTVDLEKIYFKEAGRLLADEGIDSVIELVRTLNNVHAALDIKTEYRPTLAMLDESRAKRDESRVALSLERMKELKERKSKIDAELRG